MGWGLTIPLIGVPLPAHAGVIRALPGFGYTDVWSAETAGTDAFTPLALASTWEPTMRLGTAIVPLLGHSGVIGTVTQSLNLSS